jgi:hypothetical protein
MFKEYIGQIFCLWRHRTTGEQCFAVRHLGTLKGLKRTAKALPCVDARQRWHGSVANGNALFAVRCAVYARQRPLPCQASFAVRVVCFVVPRSIAMRRQGCRACRLCCALRPFAERLNLAVGMSLPCVGRCRASARTLCRVPLGQHARQRPLQGT